MFESFNQWFEHFKILFTTTHPNPADSDDTNDIFVQARWEDYFRSSLRVYEKEHLFPSLLINYEDGLEEEDRDPNWLQKCLNMVLSSLLS